MNLFSRGPESRVRPWLYLPMNPGDSDVMPRNKDAALEALRKVKRPAACGPDGVSPSGCSISTGHQGLGVSPLLEEAKGA